MANTFCVHSTHGELYCNPETGEVLCIEPDEPGDTFSIAYLENIIKVDLAEYREWAKNSTAPEWEHDTETDILLLGYWTKDGVHELPCEDFRLSCLAEAAHYAHEQEQQASCTNPEMHVKFAERGIEDQCPHCRITPDRVGEVDNG